MATYSKSDLRYYDTENKRHPESYVLRLPWETVVEMTNFLTDAYGHPRVLVSRTKAENEVRQRNYDIKSSYHGSMDPARREIVYHPTMFSPLTVAHEVAHYLNDQRIRAEKDALDAKGLAYVSPEWSAIDQVVHGEAHRKLTDECVEKLRAQYPKLYAKKFTPKFLKQLQAEAAAIVAVRDLKIKARQLQRDFFHALPDRLTCKCCNTLLHKTEFGMRVMKRDAQGLPLKMAPQSYCKHCRSMRSHRIRW